MEKNEVGRIIMKDIMDCKVFEGLHCATLENGERYYKMVDIIRRLGLGNTLESRLYINRYGRFMLKLSRHALIDMGIPRDELPCTNAWYITTEGIERLVDNASTSEAIAINVSEIRGEDSDVQKGCEVAEVATATTTTTDNRENKNDAIRQLINDPDLVLNAFAALKGEREKNEALLAELEINKEKVEYCDKVLNATNLIPTRLIAMEYGISARTLNKILATKEIQYKFCGCWVPYKRYADEGYMKTKTFAKEINGKLVAMVHTYWTQKGRYFIDKIMSEHGLSRKTDETILG